MNLLDNLPNESIYQFPRWPSALSRPYSSFRSKDYHNDTIKLTANQSQRPDSSHSFSKRIFQHHVCIPTGSGPVSPIPPLQPNTSFDLDIKPDHFPARPISSHRRRRRYRSIPVRVKSTSLSIPITKNKDEFSLQNFPRQTHEQRKVTRERKQRKQQAKVLANKYAETDTWFQLKRSLSALKRLAISQEINNDDIAICKSESGSVASTNEGNRLSISTNQSLFSPTYSRLVFEPLTIASKPIHPLFLTNHHIPSTKSRLKPIASSIYRSRPIITPPNEEKRARLLLSDISNENNPPNSISPSPSMFKIEHQIPLQKFSTASQLTSIIKLKPQIPRSYSATDIKSSTKHRLNFILICDQEHRIESWYHQYPFIHSDDLLISFQSKYSQHISAYFIDDCQSSKTILQGKPFHINNDWKNYDLIFISNSIYDEIIIYLQTIINLIKSSGKIIQIYQINHDEDLKKQVKTICKQQQTI